MVNDSNLFDLDYRHEARTMGPPVVPIIDAHAHVSGPSAARILLEAMDLYGISEIWSMTSDIAQIDQLREIFAERIRFIAVPNWRDPDAKHSHGTGYVLRIREFYERGARIAKFWAAPRGIDIGTEVGEPKLMQLDNPVRVAAMHTAYELGMTFMVHVADPDTWFATKYSDHSKYGTKAMQYEPLERMLDRFPTRWIAAHMGGWPEDLEFLSGLLNRHANLSLDTSATKWIVREISKHPREDVVAFFHRFSGRLLFGSDIVTTDAHLQNSETKFEMDAKANNSQTAFDLYASRYWALRTLWETNAIRTSPIADPDLAMVDPQKYTPKDAPVLKGVALSQDILRGFYAGNARELMAQTLQRTAATNLI